VEKKSPYDAVIEEMSLHSTLTPDELDDALRGVMQHLEDRAKETLRTEGGDTPLALENARQFLAFTQLINYYGSALIAFEDIEDESLPN
jgi:hypothetical protein